MAKKTRVIQPDPDDTDEKDEQPEPSPAAQLEQQLAEEREGRGIAAIEEVLDCVDKLEGQFAVKRIDQLSGKQLHLERMPISILKDFGQDPSEFLKTRYGGGQYNLVFYVPEAGGGWRQYTMRRFEIDSAIPPGEFFRAQRAAQTGPDRGPDETLLSKLADKIKTEGSGNTELLIALMQMQAKQSADMLQVMMKSGADTMTAITSMVAALKGGGSDKGLDLMNALAVFDKLKGKETPFDPIRLLELAHKWFREHDRDGGEEEPSWVKMVSTFLPMLMPGAMPPGGMPPGGVPAALPQPAQPMTERTPKGQPGPNPVIESNGQPAAQPAASQEPQRPTLRDFLKQIYPVLVAKIEAGVTAEDVFDWLNNPMMADAFTDAQFDELVSLFQAPTWETDLFGDPKLVEAHKGWFQSIRGLFLESQTKEQT